MNIDMGGLDTVERTTLLRTPQGLHARPGAALVLAAGRYSCDIELEVRGRKANAKTILGVLTLGARHGDMLTIRATGVDEEAAVNGLVACLEALGQAG